RCEPGGGRLGNGANGVTESTDGMPGASQRGPRGYDRRTGAEIESPGATPNTIASGAALTDPPPGFPRPLQFRHQMPTTALLPGRSARSEPGGSVSSCQR